MRKKRRGKKHRIEKSRVHRQYHIEIIYILLSCPSSSSKNKKLVKSHLNNKPRSEKRNFSRSRHQREVKSYKKRKIDMKRTERLKDTKSMKIISENRGTGGISSDGFEKRWKRCRCKSRFVQILSTDEVGLSCWKGEPNAKKRKKGILGIKEQKPILA